MSTNRSEIVLASCRIALILLALASSAVSASRSSLGNIRQRISTLVRASPDLQGAHIGYLFVDLQTGRMLADRDPAHFFTPASNRKLFTTALALFRLGPGYTFKTELCTDEPWKPGQTVLHDLEFVGGGDPNLSGRILPYSVNARSGDPLAAVEELADKLVKLNIHEINGDVIGVATRYSGGRYPLDWTIDDATYGYGAPVSALTIDDNTISAAVSPTEPGRLAAIDLCPAADDLIILNQIVTDRSNATKIQVRRLTGSNELILSGTIGNAAPPWKQDFAVDDPALFAAEALISALRDRGIVVRGVPRSRYGYGEQVAEPCATVLATHESAPLWEDIQVVNKVSENLHAEMLLREVGLVQCRMGTLKAGLDAQTTFLTQTGIQGNSPEVSFFDGCGLAREDLATPEATVALLRYMWQSPYRELWLQTLPIGGVDGTLQDRFRGIAGADRVHAKTGSLAHVRALSGYIETTQHRWIAFSMFVNGYSADDKNVTDFIDRVCALFLGRKHHP